MCELLGMSANVPTDLCFSLRGLVRRGGDTGPHRDGWGIGLYAGRGCRLFHDPRPSIVSEVAKLIQGQAIKSHIIISHIRKATHGRVCLENTHPFARELWGSTWLFAHNGGLKGSKALALDHYRPIGTTDSERAFCWMLGRIRARYPERPRRAEPLWRLIASLGRELEALVQFSHERLPLSVRLLQQHTPLDHATGAVRGGAFDRHRGDRRLLPRNDGTGCGDRRCLEAPDRQRALASHSARLLPSVRGRRPAARAVTTR
jgi:predicted glutamine amidotransferase